jgi:hypothetical protein
MLTQFLGYYWPVPRPFYLEVLFFHNRTITIKTAPPIIISVRNQHTVLVFLFTHQRRNKLLLFLNVTFSRCSKSFAQFPFKAQWRHFSNYADSLANRTTHRPYCNITSTCNIEANLQRISVNVVCIGVLRCLACVALITYIIVVIVGACAVYSCNSVDSKSTHYVDVLSLLITP